MFIASLVMKFGIVRVGGVLSDGFGFCNIFLLVLSRFDCLGGGVECVVVHSPSEDGIVTPSEVGINGMSDVGVGSIGIITGVFALVTRWCVHGAMCGDKHVCVGTVGVDDVSVVFVCVGVTFSAVVLNIFVLEGLIILSDFMYCMCQCC